MKRESFLEADLTGPSFIRLLYAKIIIIAYSYALKARSHCTLNAHSIRFNVHWFTFTLSRCDCALSQSGLKPV